MYLHNRLLGMGDYPTLVIPSKITLPQLVFRISHHTFVSLTAPPPLCTICQSPVRCIFAYFYVACLVPRYQPSLSSPSSQISCPSPSRTHKLARRPQSAMPLKPHHTAPTIPLASPNPYR